MVVKAVIGANFGDEGKGLFTDYFVRQCASKPIVIRFNGGTQAGHTVVSDGVRFVFHSIGSGTLAGADTFLGPEFVCNPLIFLKDYEQLEQIGFTPMVYADPRCVVSTPYDMVLNQLIEEQRNKDRHGSCGLGIGETIERNLIEDFSFTLKDCVDLDQLAKKLVRIQTEYTPKRARDLGLVLPNPIFDVVLSDVVLSNFLADLEEFMSKVWLVTPRELRSSYSDFVFEGAQGLLLDQNSEFFPYVTRSNTGITNVISLLDEMELSEVDVLYATRAYLTRHGAGPLPNEGFPLPYDIVDETNITNKYQGHLRTAMLNIDLIQKYVINDYKKIPERFNKNYCMGITCLDQTKDLITAFAYGKSYQFTLESLLSVLPRRGSWSTNCFLSHGTSAKDISLLEIHA